MSRLKRIGFHYIPDMEHYKGRDLDNWLPKLTAMDANWLILPTPKDRAIPEDFIRRVLASQIEPILQFSFLPDQVPELTEIRLLLEVYAKWGVNYISFFNKPNLRSFWEATNWSKADLVERFLDIFLPLAELCLACDLIPIFPPLEPGGDYWDTVFLKASLQGIKRRGHPKLLKEMVFGAIARTNGRPLNWGLGGPELWPESIPYRQPQKGEDHLGFRIYDWYQAIIQSCLIKPRPIFLFEVSTTPRDNGGTDTQTQDTVSITQLLAGEAVPNLAPLPKEVIGAGFWLLADSEKGQNSKSAWFKSDGSHLPLVDYIQSWSKKGKTQPRPKKGESKIIQHYVLLPGLENENLEIDIDLIRPVLKKHKPTIGFSIDEARFAKRVTIINLNKAFSKDVVSELRYSGCVVQQIDDMAQLLHL